MAATTAELRAAGVPSTGGDVIAGLVGHDDVRVRVLCAGHPNLPVEFVARLAVDVVPVRRAVAGRDALDPEIAVKLATDTERSVRRIALRRQVFTRDQLRWLVEQGNRSPVVMAKLEAHLGDPDFVADMYADPRWRWVALQGTFRHRTVRRIIADENQFIVAQLAAQATLKLRSKLYLSRSPSRVVQRSIGGRGDLTRLDRLVLSVFGRQWAVVQLLHTAPRRGLVRLGASVHRGRVVGRHRAATSSNRCYLWWRSRGLDWGTHMAIAGNLHAGARTLSHLAGLRTWAPSEVLAQRTDLPVAMYGRLSFHPAVRLQLAVNAAAPRELVENYPGRDRFVVALNSIHPSLPVEQRLAVAAAPDTPAWVLRRLANDPELPTAERDRIMTWLALGGGEGDVNFDPISCMGTPGWVNEPHEQAYRRLAGDHGTYTSLWRARASVGSGAGRLDLTVLRQLAEDCDPRVRRVAAGYSAARYLHDLKVDPALMVSQQAEATLKSTRKSEMTRGKGRNRRVTSVWVSVVLASAWFMLVARLDNSNRANYSGGTLSPEVSIALANLVGTGQWHSSTPRADVAAVCDSGGNTVWVSTRDGGASVAIRASIEPTRVSGYLWSTVLQAPQQIEQRTIPVGSTWEYRYDGATAAYLHLVIGESSGHPLIVYLRSGGTVTDADMKGDC